MKEGNPQHTQDASSSVNTSDGEKKGSLYSTSLVNKVVEVRSTETEMVDVSGASAKRIVARVWPQEYRSYEYRDIGDPVEVDVTDELLALDASEIQCMEDDTDSTNDLICGADHEFHGPHRVAVVDVICEYFGVSHLVEVTQSMVDAARQQNQTQLKVIKLSAFNIVVTIAAGRAGRIESSLHDENESKEATAALNALESMILAHAVAGINVNAPAYLVGIETAVESIWNHYGEDDDDPNRETSA